jgi:hypothetical protein
MKWSPVCAKDVAEALRTTINWRGPGRNQVPNFRHKHLIATQMHIAAIFIKLIEEVRIPEWLTAGVNIFIPKNENVENSRNYRLVNCLSTM